MLTKTSKGTTVPRRPGSIALAALLFLSFAALACVLPGCDNPACIFGGNGCQGGIIPGAVGSNAAAFPSDGEQIAPEAPHVVSVFPSGMSAQPDTPIVVVFNESMSETNLNIAFELDSEGVGLLPLQNVSLIGDGHVLVMFPVTPLMLDQNYTLRFRQGVKFQDLTGQTVDQPDGRVVGTFSTAATAATVPSLGLAWPLKDSTGASATSEIVVVFDRPIDATTVDDSSFIVTAGGSAPAFDPPAQPLITDAGSFLTDTRVFRYRSVDASGARVSLGANVSVVVSLSPTSHVIRDTSMNALAPVTFDFTTTPLLAPSSVSLASIPDDAIGIDQITDAADLMVEVQVPAAQDGDFLDLYLIGTVPDGTPDARLAALLRQVKLETPFTSITLVAQEVNLVIDPSPLRPRFADGPVAFAFSLRRGSDVSPLKVLDVDADTAGVQNPVLDTERPRLLGLSTSGTNTQSFRSDQRDLVIVGRASETVRSAHVSIPGDDNVTAPGQLPPVVGSDATGLFVAAPVRVGVVAQSAQPLNYTVTIYDRALNSASSATGAFRQLGASGPDSGVASSQLSVEVFDSVTRDPVVGAMVFTHENVGGTVTALDMGVTDIDGRTSLLRSASGETIVTADAVGIAPGYDLFTFDGVPTDHLSIPLSPIGLANATVGGQVTTPNANINLYTKSIADNRTPFVGENLFPVNGCSFDANDMRFECGYAPISIRPGPVGAQSVLVADVPTNAFQYSAQTFLRAFGLSLPLTAVDIDSANTSNVAIPFFMDAGGIDPEERAIDVPQATLVSSAYPTLNGPPRVRVDAIAPGIAGAIAVGQGVAFNDGLPADTWNVRAAYAGAADGFQDVPQDALGRLVTDGVISPDLFLRVEIADNAGNRSGSRPRFSTGGSTILPPSAVVLDAVPAVPNAGGACFDLRFSDVIGDFYFEPGLYRVTLTDAAGLKWTLWRPDGPDAQGPNAVVHVPYVGAGGTLPVASGVLRCQISAVAWPSLDLTRFLWSDVERELDLFSHSRRRNITPP